MKGIWNRCQHCSWKGPEEEGPESLERFLFFFGFLNCQVTLGHPAYAKKINPVVLLDIKG